MKCFFGTLLAAGVVMSSGDRAKTAVDKDAQAILDKAIEALGGQEKLSHIKAATWKTEGKITYNGSDSEYVSTLIVQGIDRFHVTFETEFTGRGLKIVTVLNNDKGWRKVGDRKREIDKRSLADQKHATYLEVIPITLIPLKDKGFKVAVAGEKKVGDKLAIGLKVTGPEGKDFTLFLNKDSCLPIMLMAKMGDLGGTEFTQETTFADYKELAGIKKATKIVSKRDGEKFLECRVTEFKVLNKVDPKMFDEPK